MTHETAGEKASMWAEYVVDKETGEATPNTFTLHPFIEDFLSHLTEHLILEGHDAEALATSLTTFWRKYTLDGTPPIL